MACCTAGSTTARQTAKEAAQSCVAHVQGMLDFQAMGIRLSIMATTSARWRFNEGLQNAFDFPGFVPAYIRQCFVKAKVHSVGWRCLATRKISIKLMPKLKVVPQ